MMMRWTLTLGACALMAGAGGAAAAGGSTLDAAIGQVLPAGVDQADVHRLNTRWNGQAVVFVDYPVGNDRVLKAFVPEGQGYRTVDIDTFEEEGGTAEISAIAFANADQDAAQELIVLGAWPVQHYDVEGTLYEVRIFDDLTADAQPLATVSQHFGEGCDCSRRDDKPETYRYKTMAAVRKELSRMGY